MTDTYQKSLCLVALLTIFFCAAVPVHADKTDELAQSLIRIRGEVEELQNQLDMERQDHRIKMDALGSQLSDLSIENRRQRLSVEKMDQVIQKLEEAKMAKLSSEEVLLPVVSTGLDKLRNVVENSLPFKVDERLSELDDLKAQLESGKVDPNRTVNRLWAFIEDEIRLTRENGLYSQSIALNGENVLADVAKLGSMFLYFQTSNNQVGLARKENDEWRFVESQDADARQNIEKLFDSLKKQIRQGYFELPNPNES
ncbi:MAG: DUF3450 family protein [Nitrosomonas sp.]|nr:DUF3450 family protein [Nitrosomonas sp.]